MSPSCLFIHQEYPDKVSSLWRCIVVVVAQIEHVFGGVTIVLVENKEVDCQIQSSFCDQNSVSQLLLQYSWLNVSTWVVLWMFWDFLHQGPACTAAAEPPDYCPAVLEETWECGQVCKSDMFWILFCMSSVSNLNQRATLTHFWLTTLFELNKDWSSLRHWPWFWKSTHVPLHMLCPLLLILVSHSKKALALDWVS